LCQCEKKRKTIGKKEHVKLVVTKIFKAIDLEIDSKGTQSDYIKS
jgi:hypothetical protein